MVGALIADGVGVLPAHLIPSRHRAAWATYPNHSCGTGGCVLVVSPCSAMYSSQQPTEAAASAPLQEVVPLPTVTAIEVDEVNKIAIEGDDVP